MSFVGSLFSNDKGAGFQAQGTNITNPTDLGRIQAGQIAAQQGIEQGGQAINDQQAFANAVAAQNGLGNQASVYNQLQGVANGTGPNPAQAQLAQATGANVANQAALMAGQRGASSNVGLTARQASQQGGAIQQNAAGQAATMQANQSLGALNQLGGIAGQQVATQGSANQALTNARNNFAQNALAQQGQQYGAQQGYNAQNVALQSNVNNANAGIAQQNASTQGGIFTGAAKGAGMALMAADGGMIGDPSMPRSFVGRHFKGYANGGEIDTFGAPAVATADLFHGQPIKTQDSDSSSQKKQSSPNDLSGTTGTVGSMAGGPMDAGSLPMDATMFAAKGGKVPALVSPGERYLSPKEVGKVAKGEKAPMKAGEKIPGKPAVGGDKNSYANDTVHKKLQEGGIVLPRSVTQSKDPDASAIKFIAAVMAKHGRGLK